MVKLYNWETDTAKSKDPSCEKHPTICLDHKSQNFRENARFRMALINAKKYNEAFIVDSQNIFIKIIKDVTPAVSQHFRFLEDQINVPDEHEQHS